MVTGAQIKNLLIEYMKVNLRRFLGSDKFEINCYDRYGFLVCVSTIPDDGSGVEFDITRDFLSNKVELPSEIYDIPVSNIFVKQQDKIKYFVVMYWNDIQYRKREET